MSLANDLLKNFEPQIESVALRPSSGGRFEVSVNGELVYSKLQTGRHPERGEVIDLIRNLAAK